MRRRISLAIIILFVSAVAIFNDGCSGSREDEDDDNTLTFDLANPTIQERLAEDDGYAFAVFYGGDIHGSLETCG